MTVLLWYVLPMLICFAIAFFFGTSDQTLIVSCVAGVIPVINILTAMVFSGVVIAGWIGALKEIRR